MDQNQYPKPVIVEIPLINEYGTGYGVKAIVFAWNTEQAEKALLEKYGEERLSNQSNDVWSQLRISFITAYDGDGNINRQFEDWFDVLNQFNHKNIGPSVLKAIAKVFPFVD
jgi:hypothetical protein